MWQKLYEKTGEPMRQQSGMRRTIVDRLDLPKDIGLGEIKVTLYGNCEAWIENYRGLLEYTDTKILLQGCKRQICITGGRLFVRYYTNEDMRISGCIEEVRFV